MITVISIAKKPSPLALPYIPSYIPPYIPGPKRTVKSAAKNAYMMKLIAAKVSGSVYPPVLGMFWKEPADAGLD